VHVRHRNGILLTYISLTVRPYLNGFSRFRRVILLGHRHEIIWHTRLASDFRACPVIDKLRARQLLAPSLHALLPVFTARSRPYSLFRAAKARKASIGK
jgi:hypothetical protein